MDKLDELVELTKKLVDHHKSDKSASTRILHFGEKLLIPLMLGILAYVANDASNRIAQAQLNLAQDQARLQDNRQREQLRLKNLELLMQRPRKSESEQKAAIAFANYLDPDLAAIVESTFPDESRPVNAATETTFVTKTASATTIARATGTSGRWQTYQVCVNFPDGAKVDKSSVKTRVVAGVGPGSWGDWAGPVRFSGPDIDNPSTVCRAFAHQIHNQDRVLEISAKYLINAPTTSG